MTDAAPSRLVVEAVHKLSGRPWIFVSGTLEGGVVRIGDPVVVRTGTGPDVETAVRTIELHGPPGKTTIALDESLAGVVEPGIVLLVDRPL